MEQPPATETKRRPARIIVPQQAKWHGRLAARLIWLVIKCLSFTIRFRIHDRSQCFTNPDAHPEPLLFCIWHNRLGLCLELYRIYVQRRQPERRMAALVSASRDGGLLARVLELFRVQPVRGSSSRRGPQALLEMTSYAKQGLDLAVTPDGPRGPCYHVQEGVIALAQLTGRPIIPVVYHLNWKWQAKSWDRFQIPWPFACCNIEVGKPISVPRDLPETEREVWRQKVEDHLRSMTRD
ncbi:MAG: lysophospholipid acyltransferase family protein [Verrucomicrobiota bacterium]